VNSGISKEVIKMPKQLREIITEVINRLAASMNLECQIDIETPEDATGAVAVQVRTDTDARFLIGKSGQNLAALEHIVRAICYRQVGAEQRVTVDVNDYRQERTNQLTRMVQDVVAKVRDTRRAHVMLPMAPHERRIVHMELAAYTDVASESTGDDQNRRVVIKPVAF
jgi:spoIIIJ-associated protein